MGVRRWGAGLAAIAATTALLVSAVSTPAAAATSTVDAGLVQPVESVDVHRYAGVWYQVAAIPAIFESQCVKNVRARYDVKSDGTIGVRNSCRTATDDISAVVGRARSENPPANSVLSVTFVKISGEWQYFGGPNYIVIGLDPEYRWAVVGNPTRSAGFVLSREPALTADQTAAAKAVLTANGYDLCAFRTTAQDGGAPAGPFC